MLGGREGGNGGCVWGVQVNDRGREIIFQGTMKTNNVDEYEYRYSWRQAKKKVRKKCKNVK